MTDILDKMTIRALDNSARFVMSDEDYFGGGLKGYVSNSLLGLINPVQGGSPEKFNSGFGDESKYVSAFQLGSAVHALILEKDKYTLSEMEKPGGKVGYIMDDVYKMTSREENPVDFDEAVQIACKLHDYYSSSLTQRRIDSLIEKGAAYLEYIREYKTPGIIVLTKDQKEKCIAAVNSIMKNKQAVALMFPEEDDNPFAEVESFNEDVITLGVEVDIETEDGTVTVPIDLKAKIDNWSIDTDTKTVTLNDLKTTGKFVQDFPGRREDSYEQDDEGNTIIVPHFKPGSFQNYHYHRQMAMYGWMLWKYCKQHHGVGSGWKTNVNMVVVETNRPYRSQVFNVNKTWIDYGYAEFAKLLKRVAYHRHYGFDKFMDINPELVFEIK